MPEGTGQPTGPRTSAVGDRSSDDEISCLFPASERKCPVFQQTCFLAVFRGSGNTQGKSQYGSRTKPPTFYDQWDMTYDKKDRLKKENPGAPGSPQPSCHWTQNRHSPTTPGTSGQPGPTLPSAPSILAPGWPGPDRSSYLSQVIVQGHGSGVTPRPTAHRPHPQTSTKAFALCRLRSLAPPLPNAWHL